MYDGPCDRIGDTSLEMYQRGRLSITARQGVIRTSTVLHKQVETQIELREKKGAEEMKDN